MNETRTDLPNGDFEIKPDIQKDWMIMTIYFRLNYGSFYKNRNGDVVLLELNKNRETWNEYLFQYRTKTHNVTVNHEGRQSPNKLTKFDIISESREPKKTEMSKSVKGLMMFDPAYGTPKPYPSEPDQYRYWHGKIAWLYNPYTGKPRHPADIGSDVTGILIALPTALKENENED